MDKQPYEIMLHFLTLNAGKLKRFYQPGMVPEKVRFAAAVRRVAGLIVESQLTDLKLDDLDDYHLKLQQDDHAVIVLFLCFIGFYIETTTGLNRSGLNTEQISRRQNKAENYIMMLGGRYGHLVDQPLLNAWFFSKTMPISSRTVGRHSPVPVSTAAISSNPPPGS